MNKTTTNPNNCYTCNKPVLNGPSKEPFDHDDIETLVNSVERALLLPRGAVAPRENPPFCEKCFSLFQQLLDYEEKISFLREEIWTLYTSTIVKRNEDVADFIYGVAVQTEDVDDISDRDDTLDADFEASAVKMECLESEGEVEDVIEKWSGSQSDKKEEHMTVDVDPEMAQQDESKWSRWKRRPGACNVCGKWFSSKYACETHMLSHNTEAGPEETIEEEAEDAQTQQLEDDETEEQTPTEDASSDQKPRSREKKDIANKKNSKPPLVYACRVCGKKLKSKPGAMYHAKCHNFPVGGKFRLEEAFRITYLKTDEDGNTVEVEHTSGDVDTKLIIVQSDDDNNSSSEDELPLAARRTQLLIEKVQQPETKKVVRKTRKSAKTENDGGKIDTDVIAESQKEDDDSIDNLDGSLDGERSKGSEKPERGRRKLKEGVIRLKKKQDLFGPIKEPKFQCDICNKLWKTRGELNAHRTTHSDLRPYICEICGQAYKHKPALDVHVGMHKGIYQHQCPYCKKAFTQKGALQRHLPIHTGDLPYQCELCGKRFVHRTSFSIHTMAHTGVRTIKCQICEMGVLSKSHLRRHMRIHSGEKPYECSTCGKAFAERYNLVAHQRIHDPSLVGPARNQKRKPQVCRLCNASFDRRHKLEDHMVQAHNKIVEDPPQQQAQNRVFENSAESFLSQRFIVTESTASSKGGESQNSEDAKEVPSVDLSMRGLRNIDLIRSIDPSRGIELITHHWAYMNPTT